MKKKENILLRRQLIKAPLQQVWAFFSSPRNLAKITPDWLDFRIVSCPDVAEIFPGMLITYRVKPLLSVPVEWVTKITEADGPYRFIDEQVKGPYKLWRHEHRFTPVAEGVMMEDVVHYDVGFGSAGKWINRWVVEKKLKEIFDHRHSIVHKIFEAS